jgi:hypothetical protein
LKADLEGACRSAPRHGAQLTGRDQPDLNRSRGGMKRADDGDAVLEMRTQHREGIAVAATGKRGERSVNLV